MFRQIFLFVVAILGQLFVADPVVVAQDWHLMGLYGKGVHAFFGGDHTEAQKHLDDAVHHGINDPRAYYFRGLIKASSGNITDAEEDYRLGATLEARGAGIFDVGSALIRIQGDDRVHLEKIRHSILLSLRGQRPALPDTLSAEPMLPSEPLLPAGPPAALEPDDLPTSKPLPTTDEPAAEVVEPIEENDLFDEEEENLDDPFSDQDSEDIADPFDSDGEDPFGDADAADLFDGDDVDNDDVDDPFAEEPDLFEQ